MLTNQLVPKNMLCCQALVATWLSGLLPMTQEPTVPASHLLLHPGISAITAIVQQVISDILFPSSAATRPRLSTLKIAV